MTKNCFTFYGSLVKVNYLTQTELNLIQKELDHFQLGL